MIEVSNIYILSIRYVDTGVQHYTTYLAAKRRGNINKENCLVPVSSRNIFERNVTIVLKI